MLNFTAGGAYTHCYDHPTKKNYVLLASIDKLKLAMSSINNVYFPRLDIIGYYGEFTFYETERCYEISSVEHKTLFEKLNSCYPDDFIVSEIYRHYSDGYGNFTVPYNANDYCLVEDFYALHIARTIKNSKVITMVNAILELKKKYYKEFGYKPLCVDLHKFNVMKTKRGAFKLIDPVCAQDLNESIENYETIYYLEPLEDILEKKGYV